MYNSAQTTTDFRTAILQVYPEWSVTSNDIETLQLVKEVKQYD